MKWKMAFVLLLTIEAVLSAPPLTVEETLGFLVQLGQCFVKCYNEITWREPLCVNMYGSQLTLANKTFNCMQAKCPGGQDMSFLYMGFCGQPIPSTGHISTEPMIPSIYRRRVEKKQFNFA